MIVAKRKWNILIAFLFFFIAGLSAFFHMKYMPILMALAGVLLLLNIYRVRMFDLVLILLPFMFYLRIGGAINTSASDFILVIWLYFAIRNSGGKLFSSLNPSIIYAKSYMMRYGLIFMLIMLLSTINIVRWNNPLIYGAFLSIFKILICLLYSMFTLFYIDKYGRKRFLCIMAYSTIFFELLMIFGVIAYSMGVDLGLTFSGTFRATGTFEDPNLAAAHLFLMVSFAFVYFLEEKKHVMLGITGVLTFTSVFLTSSKGAFVATVFGLSFILIINIVSGKTKNTLIFLFSYVIVAAILYYLYLKIPFVRQLAEPVINRLDEFTGNIEGDHSLAHREFLWKTAFDLGTMEPILGVGVEQFRPAASQYTGKYVWNIVHNTYLTFFCELGVVGFIAFFRLWIKNISGHLLLLNKNKTSVFYLLSMLCVSVSMWSISLGNFRTLWIFMTFTLYEMKSLQMDLKIF